jgi:hypothetical protein
MVGIVSPIGRNEMRLFVAGLLLCVIIFASQASAQVDVQYQPEMQVLVLMLKEQVAQDSGLPLVKVEMGKILLRNGAFIKELPVRFEEMKLLPELMKKNFRLYRGPKQFGIYKYASVSGDLKPRKGGAYISAMPVSKDETIQAISAETREQADILNLLNMSVEEAAAAAKNESKLNESLAKAESTEIALLKTGKLDKAPLFFVPVKAQK